jgi:hypothetical protein
VDTRLTQALQALDDMRGMYHRFLLTLLLVFCTGIIAVLGYNIYRASADRVTPPRIRSFAPVPLFIEGRAVQLGVAVVEWDVPREVTAAYVAVERERRAREEAEERGRGEDVQPSDAGTRPEPGASP